MAVLDNFVCGSFTSDGLAHNLNIRCDVDYIEFENLTVIATPEAGAGVRFRWQRGMLQDSAIQDTVDGAGAVSTGQILVGGISLVNTSDPQVPSALLTASAITNAAPPVVTSANTGSMQNGDIVQIINSATAPQLNGYQFTVSALVVNTSFDLEYMVAPGSVGGATSYRFFKYDPMFYPRRRLIVSISQAVQAVVVMSVVHGYTVGQLVNFVIPKQFGMTQLNGIRATIVAIDLSANSITINVDTTAFTAFTFPTAAVAAAPFTPAQVIPFGDGLDVTQPLQTSSTLAGATRNTAIIGVHFGAGDNGPGGDEGDVIFWRAWKASQIQTTFV